MTRLTTILPCILLAACTQPSAEDDGETSETGETGDPMIDEEACVDPGTDLLPAAKPALLPSPMAPVMYTCTTGWGTDAPQLDPEWTMQIGELADAFSFDAPMMKAHPDGGVIFIGMGQFSHYGPEGDALWTKPTSTTGAHYLAIEEAGTILVALYDWNTGESSLTRYDAGGEEVGVIDIPWIGSSPNIWGVATLGTDIVVAGNDEDMQGNYESALIRLDVDGNVVLRKSTSMAGGQLLAVNEGGVAMFGTFPGFLVALDNGEVLGMLTPSMGNVSTVVGFGDDFYMAGNVTGTSTDFGVGRYTSTGGEQWLQGYDRATLTDVARTLAVGPDGNLAVVGITSLLNNTDTYWYNTQPIVFGVDPDGNALWSDRISAHGDAMAVAVGADGDVYVAGTADAGADLGPQEDPPVMVWLRRYVP